VQLFDVGVQFKILNEHANSLKDRQPAIAAHIIACISNEWNSHINEHAVIATAILSGAPSLSTLYDSTKLIEAQEYILNWGTIFLRYYQYSSAADVSKELTSQFVEFTGKSQRFQGFQKRIESTKTFMQKLDSTVIEFISPISVWQSFREGAVELSIVAIAILSICASEAAVERSFSIQDRIHSKSRNRSKEDLVEAQVFVKFNTAALESGSHNKQFDLVEISNEFEPSNQIILSYLSPEVAPEEKKEVQLQQEDLVIMEQQEEDEEEEDEEAEVLEVLAAPAPPPPARRIATPEEIRAFALEYIQAHKLNKSSILFGDKENELANAIFLSNPRIISTLVDLKKLIKMLAPAVP
jgi:hypothetical protein